MKIRITLTNATPGFFRTVFRIGDASGKPKLLKLNQLILPIDSLDIRRRSMELQVPDGELKTLADFCCRLTGAYRKLTVDMTTVADEGHKYLTGHLYRYGKGNGSRVNTCGISRTGTLYDAYMALKN